MAYSTEFKKEVVNEILTGDKSARRIIAERGLNRSSVLNWLKLYKLGGDELLVNKPLGGAAQKMTAEERLDRVIKPKIPKKIPKGSVQ